MGNKIILLSPLTCLHDFNPQSENDITLFPSFRSYILCSFYVVAFLSALTRKCRDSYNELALSLPIKIRNVFIFPNNTSELYGCLTRSHCIWPVSLILLQRSQRINYWISNSQKFSLVAYLSSYHEKACNQSAATTSLRSCRLSAYHTKTEEFR